MSKPSIERVSESRCFEGRQIVYQHASEACACTMRFAAYLPAAAERGPVPALYWLSGLTCTEDNFSVKSGAQRYAAEQNAAWPVARGALLRIAEAKAPDQVKTFAALPDNAIRPLADALIEQELAAKIHPRSCRNIERMAEAISPLDPRDASRVLGVLFDIASASDKLVATLGKLPAHPEFLRLGVQVQAEHGRALVSELEDDAVVPRPVAALVVVLREEVRDPVPSLRAVPHVVVAVPFGTVTARV